MGTELSRILNRFSWARLQRFCRPQEVGATAVEYGILVALVALALIAGVVLLQNGVKAVYVAEASDLSSPPATSPPATSPPTSPGPTSPGPTSPGPTSPGPPAPGPTLALSASVAKGGELTSNVLSKLNPPGTLTAMTFPNKGKGELVSWTAGGNYVFKADNGKATTVITFDYTQNGIPVTGNTVTITTG